MLQSWEGDLAAFQAVLGGAKMPTILADAREADHPIIFVNQAFLDLSGYAREAVLGRNCRFLQGPETDRATVLRIRQALLRGEPVCADLINYRSDGSRFWNALSIGPVFDGDGELRYFLANQLDVTAQKAAEQALQEQHRFEAVGQLATGLAHTLNNRLQVLGGALELMAALAQDEKAERQGAVALRAARASADLVDQVLAFARKAPLSPRPLNLAQTIPDMHPLLDVAAEGRRLSLQIDTPLRQVLLDQSWFEITLLSLVANAREATSGDGRIVIRIQNAELEAGPAVAVSVEDDGVGMSREVLQRAAEPFFSTKSPAHSAGLGLSMASGFAAQSRGRLDVQSESGSGARVRLVFPAMDAAKALHIVEIASEPGPPGPGQPSSLE